jgi:membrane protease YdiL (CAAX protease family)
MPKTPERKVMVGVLAAFLLWYLVFLSDLFFSFWFRVTGAAITLALYAYWSKENRRLTSPTIQEIIKGLLSGTLLYALFYFGFNVFRPLVAGGAANVYTFRAELPLIITSSLLLITSFCEEYFWRNYTQNSLVKTYGFTGIILTSILYAGIHVSTLNLPLVFAALIAGLAWGLLYEYTESIWVVVFSHIVWTELIFVFLPLK